MRGGWSRFGLYIAVVVLLVAIVTIATAGGGGGFEVIAAQLLFIAAMAYLLTFVIWPRRNRLSGRRDANTQANDGQEKKAPAVSPKPDKRPVMRIGNREPGSRPAAEVHARDRIAERPSRGRRPTERQSTGEMRWPAR